MHVVKANGQDWLRLSEAAALGVSLSTLRRWSDTGKLVCYRSPGGHRRTGAPTSTRCFASRAERHSPPARPACRLRSPRETVTSTSWPRRCQCLPG